MSSLPLHSKIRRVFQKIFNRFISLFYKSKFQNTKIDKNEIHSILIIRINYRIGNTLFITPLVSALQKEMPDAKIDILVGASFTKVLFDGFINVKSVYDFPRKLLKNPFFLIKYIKQLRSKRYDLVVAPNSGSSSDKLATLLAKGKYKLGVCKYDTWNPVNRCTPDTTLFRHEALKPLALMDIFQTNTKYEQTLTISLQENEKKNAKDILTNLLSKYGFHGNNIAIALFRGARFEKKIDSQWWLDFVKNMRSINNNLVFIDILSPDIKEPLEPDIITFNEKNLRKLGAFLSTLNAFICGDTGPMHLASASKVCTIALFKHTSPDMYGTLGKCDKSYNITQLSTKELAKNINEHIINQAKMM